MKIEFQNNLNNALFEAVKNGYVNAVLKLLKRGADIEGLQNGLTPILFASQQGQKAVVRALLDSGAIIGPEANKVLEILEQEGPAMVRAIGCSDGNNRENLKQEGIDYDRETQKLEADRKNKLKNIDSYIKGSQKIPTISHHIYFTNPEYPRAIDPVSISKTIKTIVNLDKTANWQHYFWTNDASAIPNSLTSLNNAEVHLIDEMADSPIYPELMQVLSAAKDKAGFVTASDIARIMVLEKGGVYFDLDYEVYRAGKLLTLTRAFDFIGGKEAEEATNKETRLIGNSILAASPNHPVIQTSMQLVKRNFDLNNADRIPQYIKTPCSQASAVAYKSGGPVISTAYYLSANNGTNDIIFPSGIFYNYPYAWSITPESICHRPGSVVALDSNAIGADMFCGGWTAVNMIYYPQNLDGYLFEAALLGYSRIAEYFLKLGANIEARSRHGAAPLYAAAHNGHTDTVNFLLNNGANIEAVSLSGATPLYIAAENGHVETIKLLLSRGANKNFATQVNLSQVALKNGHVEAAKLLMDEEKPACYAGETKEIFAQEEIDYYVSDRILMQDSDYKLKHLSEFLGDETKIPAITHQMYFSSKIAPKAIDDLSLNITINSLNRLNKVSSAWKHYMWTNDANIIPDSIKNIDNVEVHLINELSDSRLYTQLNIILEQAEQDKAMFSKASDFVRYTALQKFGGVYRDLDYEFYRAERFFELMKSFNFLGGKEFTHDPVFMGSACVSATPNHPIINTALDILERNFNGSNAPDYVKYPCHKVFKLVYETGPAVISMAIHKSANQAGNIDLIMPGYYLFNMDYANHINPTSLCHLPGRNLNLDMYKNTMGADLFCGSWHKIKGYEDRIYYPHDLHNAVRRGDRKAVKLMLEKGISIENGPEIDTIEENIMEILLSVGNRSVLFLGCYDGNSEVVFAQEGIDYKAANQALLVDTAYKRSHINDYLGEDQKIPTITHQIYFASSSALKMMDNISQQKTIVNAERLNALEGTKWQHIIWTNDVSVVPANVSNVVNVEVHLIDELQDSILYPDLLKLLEQSTSKKKLLVAASDVARLMALKKYGGIYHDLDYEIFRPEKLLELTRSFNFFGGKEGGENGSKLTLIGNSIIAASPEHPVINKATQIASKNMNGLGQEYSKYPCGKSSELVFKAGGPIISMAYLLAANKNDTIDIVMPNSVFYDFDYIRYITPESKCHIPGHVATLRPDAIGADMFCGSWHENSGFENLNYHAKNNDAYLFEAAMHGYTRIVEFFVNKQADINAVSRLGATPLYMAAQNGHLDTVKYLLEHGANANDMAVHGFTALCDASAKGNKALVAELLKHDAKVDIKCHGESAIQLAAKNSHMDVMKLLINGVDMFCAQNIDEQFMEICGKDEL